MIQPIDFKFFCKCPATHADTDGFCMKHEQWNGAATAVLDQKALATAAYGTGVEAGVEHTNDLGDYWNLSSIQRTLTDKPQAPCSPFSSGPLCTAWENGFADSTAYRACPLS
jgi:hypothetical protein